MDEGRPVSMRGDCSRPTSQDRRLLGLRMVSRGGWREKFHHGTPWEWQRVTRGMAASRHFRQVRRPAPPQGPHDGEVLPEALDFHAQEICGLGSPHAFTLESFGRVPFFKRGLKSRPKGRWSMENQMFTSMSQSLQIGHWAYMTQTRPGVFESVRRPGTTVDRFLTPAPPLPGPRRRSLNCACVDNRVCCPANIRGRYGVSLSALWNSTLVSTALQGGVVHSLFG